MEYSRVSIKHIDALVHPDYIVREDKEALVTPAQAQRKQAWIARVEEIAQREGNVLLYFSTFPYLSTKEEKTRIKIFSELLGDRFFCFAGDDYPTRRQLTQKFRKRGFDYDPEVTTLLAYGAYYDRCVGQFGEHIQTILHLPPGHYAPSPELSLHPR